MRFFSGFSFRDEAPRFGRFIKKGDYVVAGFSYGAVKAALYANEFSERVDTLQLFSPAFFQTRDKAFLRAQLLGYKRCESSYLKRFAQGCFAPYPVDETLLRVPTSGEELDALLTFVWTRELMESLLAKGIAIEVYLGAEDAIIDVEGARAFFVEYATVYTLNRGNHFLQESE